MDKELNGCVGDEYDIVCVHAYIALSLASDPGSLSEGGDSLVPRLSWGEEKESQVRNDGMRQNLCILSVNYLIIYY